MRQRNTEFLSSLQLITDNEKLRRDISARFDALPINPQEYSALKSLLSKEENIGDFIRLESKIKGIPVNKRASVLLLLKYLDEIKNNPKNSIDILMSIPNYDKKIPEGIVHFKVQDRRQVIILFLLYTLDFDCSLIGFEIENSTIPRYSDYLKFLYITQIQFTITRYSFAENL